LARTSCRQTGAQTRKSEIGQQSSPSGPGWFVLRPRLRNHGPGSSIRRRGTRTDGIGVQTLSSQTVWFTEQFSYLRQPPAPHYFGASFLETGSRSTGRGRCHVFDATGVAGPDRDWAAEGPGSVLVDVDERCTVETEHHRLPQIGVDERRRRVPPTSHAAEA
jgi:hypothetical protein